MLITILEIPREITIESLIIEAKGFSAHVTMNRSIPTGYGPFSVFTVNCKDGNALATVALTVFNFTMLIDRETSVEAYLGVWDTENHTRGVVGSHPLYREN